MNTQDAHTERPLERPLNEEGCLSFVAESHFEAVRQIQAEIGLDALVVNTRKVPAKGLGRLWKKPQVELTVKPKQPQTQAGDSPTTSSPLPSRPTSTERKRSPLLNVYDQDESTSLPDAPDTPPATTKEPGEQALPCPQPVDTSAKPQIASAIKSAEQQCESILNRIGLDKLLVARICDEAAIHFKHRPIPRNRELLDFCRARFGQMWKSPKTSYLSEKKPIVLLGAPGVGKSTLIGKWVSILSLKTDLPPTIWKLDGLRANTDDFLDLIADLHQVPLHRVPPPSTPNHENEPLFIDIPGVDWNDAAQLRHLSQKLETLPAATHYLVLNAAYDNDILKRQIRAYSQFPIDGLILTHLDEEKRWTKILNVTIGTNFPLRIVSGGQNIPGYFQAVDSEEILSHIFPTNQQISLE